MKKAFALAIFFSVAAWPGAVPAGEPEPGPLAAYVAKPDPSYGWTKVRAGALGKASYAELVLTSQTWQDITWKHQLYIIRPANVAADARQAVLIIAGGRWRDKYEDSASAARVPREAALFAMVAQQVQAPVAVLLQVPFQPMFDGKVEDAIIALTFEKYLRTGDAQWPLLLPMVKSAVRAMDTVQQFCKDEWSIDIDSFTVTGASKRGWTTWLTGAVDKRAKALAPMVIDTLNMRPQMAHQVEAWGGYSDKIHDYTERGLQTQLATDAGAALRAIVDPYAYRRQLDQPKLIMIGTNDHYWPLDALNLYWQDLVGEKYILYVPNNRHGLDDFARIIGGIVALHQHVAYGKKMPQLSWTFSRAGDKVALRLQSDQAPNKVQVWLAKAASRDFREARWTARRIDAEGSAYVYQLPVPQSGYAAMFGEAVYGDGVLPCYLSTNVHIVNAEGIVAADLKGTRR